MNAYNLYSEIEKIQKLVESGNEDQVNQELEKYILLDQWQSPLIYGYLYIKQKGTLPVAAFFAKNIIEFIENNCESKEKCNKTISIAGRVASKKFALIRQQTNQFLVATTFSVFLFDKRILREAIETIQKIIAKKIRQIKKHFIDNVPLADYASILKIHYQKNAIAFVELNSFFDELIKDAGLYEASEIEMRTANLKKCLELLIEEVGRKIEKPDRIFSIADSLDIISKYAESLFDSNCAEGEKFFNKYNWAYPRGRSFCDLNAFWTTCMVGLYLFIKALDRYMDTKQEMVKTNETSKKNKIKDQDISNYNPEFNEKRLSKNLLQSETSKEMQLRI